ncbi:hypothetical protein MBLNU459_g3160t1 [Dothideomycetes sp. NU459]
MKFAKELDSDLVPEWRVKYLDYKAGKKRLKAVARAIRNVERTPTVNGQQISPFATSTFRQNSLYAPLSRSDTHTGDRRASEVEVRPQSGSVMNGNDETRRASALPIPGARDAERTPLQSGHVASERGPAGQRMTRYGSIIGSPPGHGPDSSRGADKAPSLKLPGPALDSAPQEGSGQSGERRVQIRNNSAETNRLRSTMSGGSGNAYEVGDTTRHSSLVPRYRSVFLPKRVNSMSGVQDATPTGLTPKRLLTLRRSNTSGSRQENDIPLSVYQEVNLRQDEFFAFLDKEMEKIEDFYKTKEKEATERLHVLRGQLHIMRDRRMEELAHAATPHNKRVSQATEIMSTNGLLSRDGTQQNGDDPGEQKKAAWYNQVDRVYKGGRIGKTSRAMKELGTPSGPTPLEQGRDYVRRKRPHEVPYRTAKHKLKIALAEFYRGLELLKSYALLNRTAFQKINKKFDKTVRAKPAGRYMSDKVNKAHFVNSGLVDEHIQAVEDLYARYFERGNHKLAVGKLRQKLARTGDYTGSVFRNGLLLATGAVFGIQGIVYGAELLFDSNPTLVVHTSYLLQIYAGYFLMLFLSLLFCLACRVWQRAKVNYAFIFEFDTRHHIDWRQLSELPCFLWFCLGVTIWLNFSRFVNDSFYVYWPVVLIGVSVIFLFQPLPIIYHRSRFWFIHSNWRLLLAGVFPVEFRDFFLGDMYCSQTYALGNLELFFCLYAQDWRDPPLCNSSHSRLLGFFAALPGIWRLLQCLRRYYDTRNVFPHLVNGGKYTATIMYYVSLSLYRIAKTSELRAFFIFCATINSVYCSVWDIVMDWSLVDPYAKHRFLRTTLGFKYTWWYYGAMLIDPIIRFNWIFYAIYLHDAQHSTLVSFFVAFTEVLRRGIWTLFRVENEHCTNVGRFRASRDVPLPYEASDSTDSLVDKTTSEEATAPGHTAQQDVESQAQAEGVQPTRVASNSTTGAESASHAVGTVRQRRRTAASESPVVRVFSRMGTLLHSAHAQDFERRRRPEVGRNGSGSMDDDDDDDDDDDHDTSDEEAEDEVRRRQQEHQSHGRAGQERGEGSSEGEISPREEHGQVYSTDDEQVLAGLAAAHEAVSTARGNGHA